MQFDRTGIILYVKAYSLCIDFYENTLKLSKLFENEILTCFDFGGAYLMIEIDDQGLSDPAPNSRTRTCLRMNVENVKKKAQQLITAGVKVDYQEHAWGIVAKFHDPDGNLLAFKDSKTTEQQIKGSGLSEST